MKCANCGSEVGDDNKFCPNCGDKMVSSGEANQTAPVELSKPSEATVDLAESEKESLLSGGEPIVTPSQPLIDNMSQTNSDLNMSQTNPDFSSNTQSGGQTQVNVKAAGNNEQPPK